VEVGRSDTCGSFFVRGYVVKRGKTVWAFAIASAAISLFVCSVIACAQDTPPLSAKISMAKEEYLAGEPVYVHFEVTNTGKDAVQYSTGDPYSDACGGYVLRVSNASSNLGSANALVSCRPRVNAECHGSSQILPPRETERQNILVNFAHDLSQPGEYEIDAVRTLKYSPVTGETILPSDAKTFRFESKLKIHLLHGDKDSLQRIYDIYVRNLRSPDEDIQRDAQRAIVSGAPSWLEETIEGMLRRYTSREFALLGLKNLNTARSREELAKIVKDTSELTPENEAAVNYLAEMGDKQYFPMVLEIAKKVPASEGVNYVMAAAELGGDDAVPYLQGLLASKDVATRSMAVSALGNTGSRAAVSVLIDLMKGSKDPEFLKLVGSALTELTHQSMQAEKWQGWWDDRGKSAKIYGEKDCGQ
jgi:HEAT repeats